MATYLLKFDYQGHKVGTFLYDSTTSNYGLASDDSRLTGIEHVSVKTREGPSFTIPKGHLRLYG